MIVRTYNHSPTVVDESTTRCFWCDLKYPNPDEVCYVVKLNVYCEEETDFGGAVSESGQTKGT